MNEQAARLRLAAEVIGRESREGWAVTCESAAEEIDRLMEENKRLREAVKAAYERAADKCRRHADSARGAANVGAGIDVFVLRYVDGCSDCADAILAMGESDAE